GSRRSDILNPAGVDAQPAIKANAVNARVAWITLRKPGSPSLRVAATIVVFMMRFPALSLHETACGKATHTGLFSRAIPDACPARRCGRHAVRQCDQPSERWTADGRGPASYARPSTAPWMPALASRIRYPTQR